MGFAWVQCFISIRQIIYSLNTEETKIDVKYRLRETETSGGAQGGEDEGGGVKPPTVICSIYHHEPSAVADLDSSAFIIRDSSEGEHTGILKSLTETVYM